MSSPHDARKHDETPRLDTNRCGGLRAGNGHF